MTTPLTKMPRLWTSLTLGLGVATLPMALHADTEAGEAGESGATSAPVTEVGEAGEAGLAAHDNENTAYATRLALVDAHLRAALEAQRAGFVDEAVGLAGHPEAEVMEELREEFEERGVADFGDAMAAYGDALYDGVADEDLLAQYATLHADIAVAIRAGGVPDRSIFDAIQALVKGAAIEYEEAVEDADEIEPVPMLEANGFLAVARTMAEELAASSSETTVKAATKAIAEIDAANALLAAAEAPDSSILFATAARIEIAGLRVE